jgi:predicted lipoprotein with Yx(FWY)xxD motif
VVKSASNSKLGGTVLVNSQGLTLYHLSAEQGGKFICTSASCTQVWHPVTIASGAKPSGTVGSLGVVKRPDGTEQVTYKGMPLYTFAHDTAAGQDNGQGIKDVGTWTAVTTSAAKASAPASSAPASSTPSSSGGGYAY